MSETKLFSVAGIVTDGKGRSKVRFGNDLAGRIKVLAKSAGASRIDFVALPNSMGKVDALKYLAGHEMFQSAEDQAVIADGLANRMPKTVKEPKVSKSKKETKVKSSKKNAPSLDSIKARAKSSKDSTVAENTSVAESV